MSKEKSLGKEIIEGLTDLCETIEKGEPIEDKFKVTQVAKTRRIALDFKIAQTIEKPPGLVIPKGEFVVIIDYPIDNEHTFVITGPLSALNIAKLIAKEYSEVIYADEEKFGLWHNVDIDDLRLECLNIDYEKRTIVPEVWPRFDRLREALLK